MSHPPPIRSAAVLGAGTMGAQIAAHLANAGVPTLLLDLTADVARGGLKKALGLKPDPFFTPDTQSLITVGGFDDSLSAIAAADLVVEAVVEQLSIKRALLERVDTVRAPNTIVSSNTSGIPIGRLSEGLSDGFRRHWLGTHFFNPPRYLRLLELIPTPETDRSVVERITRFADLHLGKGVVIARDHPNFIANHIGIYAAVQILRALASGEYTIEEIDEITGPVLGRPKSATFRTLDIAGLDVLAIVASNGGLDLPAFVRSLLDRGWLGEKSGHGFYKKQTAASGDSEILALDPATLTYRPRQPVRLPALDSARHVDDPAERTRALFFDQGKVGAFLRSTLGSTLLHAARVAPDIAYSLDDVDRAMQWGYGWELGPFELWDALGVRETLHALRESAVLRDEPLPALLQGILGSDANRFRVGGVPAADPGVQILKSAKDRSGVVRRNSGASLVDLGDGVLAVEFHSKMNTIGGDTVEMLQAGVAVATTNGIALVVGNEAVNFSAGANLMLVLLEAQEGNWDAIDLMVRTFQSTNQSLRYADVPVIVAPTGLTIGGGCEIALHGDRIQAAAESYIGLVEAGVGLIPAGGGVKEMLARHLDPQRVLETLGFAKVSKSAADARSLGFLREADRISMNRERVIADAKELALDRVRDGYRRPTDRTISVGGDSVLAALKLGVHLAWRAGRISDHDQAIGRALARIIAGGSLPHATTVSEGYILELEREAFLKLCGERKTLERIQYTLKTGKALRN
jgi:3-hydroxyacyl-CoA dehydrogenase